LRPNSITSAAHNDMQNMAFFYTHKLFKKLVELGELEETK
jgi:hypothetical protein